jgi:KDO2-lipid IV(A) lauroyltransferase
MKTIFAQLRYFFEYIAVLIFWYFFRLFSIDTSSYLGGKLALFIGALLPANKTAMRNLVKCFPTMEETERKVIIRKMWENLGRIIGELPHWHAMSDSEFTKRVSLAFPDSSASVLSLLPGNFCLSAHYGNWEIYCKLYQICNIDADFVYRPANNPFVDKIINQQRKFPKINLIKKGKSGVRQIIRALQEKRCVGMLIDQRTDDGIIVPFLGLAAKTTAAPANIALKYKRDIILSRVVRTNGAHYRVDFFAPIKFNPQDTAEKIMTKVNNYLEKWVREHPEQWFWVHNRWGKL